MLDPIKLLMITISSSNVAESHDENSVVTNAKYKLGGSFPSNYVGTKLYDIQAL